MSTSSVRPFTNSFRISPALRLAPGVVRVKALHSLVELGVLILRSQGPKDLYEEVPKAGHPPFILSQPRDEQLFGDILHGLHAVVNQRHDVRLANTARPDEKGVMLPNASGALSGCGQQPYPRGGASAPEPPPAPHAA